MASAVPARGQTTDGSGTRQYFASFANGIEQVRANRPGAEYSQDQVIGRSEDEPVSGWIGRKTAWAKGKFERATRGGTLFGFWDVGAFVPSGGTASSLIGDLEFDFERSIGSYVQAAGAVVYNREAGTQMSVGFVDYHFRGGMIAPRGRIFAEKGFHIQAGRFDIPFGGDWKSFASKDRIEVTPPLTTEMIMDGGYNDYGARVVATHAAINYTGYVLRGLGQGKAFGGRIGLTPFSTPYVMVGSRDPLFEAGISYLYDTDAAGGPENRIAALDLETRLSGLKVQLEYLTRNGISDEDGSRVRRKGFHISASEDLPSIGRIPLKIYGCYERFNRSAPDSGDADPSSSLLLNWFQQGRSSLQALIISPSLFLNYLQPFNREFCCFRSSVAEVGLRAKC